MLDKIGNELYEYDHVFQKFYLWKKCMYALCNDDHHMI